MAACNCVHLKLDTAEVTLMSHLYYVSLSDGEKDNIGGANGGRVR